LGKPIKEAAAKVGFSDHYYFLKVFKRVKGLSPSAYGRSGLALA
jgi:YesN/AraC family two-component response regulator